MAVPLSRIPRFTERAGQSPALQCRVSASISKSPVTTTVTRAAFPEFECVVAAFVERHGITAISGLRWRLEAPAPGKSAQGGSPAKTWSLRRR